MCAIEQHAVEPVQNVLAAALDEPLYTEVSKLIEHNRSITILGPACLVLRPSLSLPLLLAMRLPLGVMLLTRSMSLIASVGWLV